MEQKLKGLCAFVFGGSAYFGLKNAGIDVDTVLEITDDMVDKNSYHLVTNKAAHVIPRCGWEGELTQWENKVDVFFCNPPCSGLSMINRHASADNDVNKFIVEVAGMAKTIKPKVFILENAPTLATIGAPVLKELLKTMGEDYRFTILRDQGGRHGVAMSRARTIVFGWRKDVFANTPILDHEAAEAMTAERFVKSVKYLGINDKMPTEHEDDIFLNEKMYEHCLSNKTIIQSFAEQTCKHSLLEDWATRGTAHEKKKKKSAIKHIHRTNDYKEQGRVTFDKSFFMPALEGKFPSMTSLARFLHPVEKRPLYISEYAQLMGYPADFKFHEESQVPIVQAIAQGVPAQYVQFFGEQAKKALNGELRRSETDIVFQNNITGKYHIFNMVDLEKISKFEIVTIEKELEVKATELNK